MPFSIDHQYDRHPYLNLGQRVFSKQEHSTGSPLWHTSAQGRTNSYDTLSRSYVTHLHDGTASGMFNGGRYDNQRNTVVGRFTNLPIWKAVRAHVLCGGGLCREKDQI